MVLNQKLYSKNPFIYDFTTEQQFRKYVNINWVLGLVINVFVVLFYYHEDKIAEKTDPVTQIISSDIDFD
jgi:hypothetical protein